MSERRPSAGSNHGRDDVVVALGEGASSAAGIPFERAFGIAHVMNNLLAVVAGNLEEIQDDRHVPAPAREAAAIGLVTAERAARLMRSMMATLTGQAFRPGRCDSAVLLRSLSTSRHGRGGRRLVVAAEAALPLMVDPVALTDLLGNTLDALQPQPPDDVIGLSCRLVIGPTGLPPGQYGELQISGGRWQSPKWQQRALGADPLDILREFCRSAGGAADIRQEEGGGVTVRLRLPMIDERSPGQRSLAKSPRISHVLVVDDDEAVRLHAERVIASLGYRVLSAPSGEDALALVESAAPVDVLFTDVIMPGGMSGGELAERVCQIRPEMPIVFTSGHNADPKVAAILRREGAAMLPKPYRRSGLAEMLQAAIAQAGHPPTSHPAHL